MFERRASSKRKARAATKSTKRFLEVSLRVALGLACLCLAGLSSLRLARAQDYLLQTGSPTFTTAEPVEHGFVNTANGNQHTEIPLASPVQRGSLRYYAALVYDSRIWEYSAGVWHPDNVSNSQQGGWRFVTSVDPGGVSHITGSQTCGSPPTGHITSYSSFTWTAYDGTSHTFPAYTQFVSGTGCGQTSVDSSDALAQDSTGYHMYVTSYTRPTIFAKDGTVVHDELQPTSTYTMKDANGNFTSADANGNVIDALGRTPVTYVANGTGCSTSYCYNVLTPGGVTSQFKVTTTTVNVNTSFGQSGVTEYSGSFTAIQSIQLPDGTSYQFGYDSGTTAGHYGDLTSITLPTTGQVTYDYTVFADSNGKRNHWVNHRTSGGGTWTYAPAAGVTCPSSAPSGSVCQKVTVTRPSGDYTVRTFIISNGGWTAEADYFASGGGTALATVTNTYDFSQTCTGCTGPAYIRKLTAQTSFPSGGTGGATITNQTTYTFDTAQMGNITAVKEWKYVSGSSPTFSSTPDRETDLT